MAKHTVTLIPGDGIGPEIIAATVRIIEATGVDIEWETQIIGAYALEKFGVTIPEATIESIKKNKVALKGPLTTPVGKGFTSVNVGLRKALDLYANVRPIKALPNVPCRYPELDLVIVRENTESLYAGLEHVVIPGVVESLKIITEKASTRIARYAFEFARPPQGDGDAQGKHHETFGRAFSRMFLQRRQKFPGNRGGRQNH
jgi:isocitrate dehydrogenase (NAD+)